MRRLLQAIAMIVSIILLAVGLHFAMIAIDPIPIRVGMTWKEAQRQLDRVVTFDVASGIQAATPYDAETGRPEHRARLRFVSFPDRRCLAIWLRAKYDPTATREDEIDWRVNTFELGPVGKGYGGKWKWMEAIKTYPDLIKLGAYHPRSLALWVATLVAVLLVIARSIRLALRGATTPTHSS